MFWTIFLKNISRLGFTKHSLELFQDYPFYHRRLTNFYFFENDTRERESSIYRTVPYKEYWRFKSSHYSINLYTLSNDLQLEL